MIEFEVASGTKEDLDQDNYIQQLEQKIAEMRITPRPHYSKLTGYGQKTVSDEQVRHGVRLAQCFLNGLISESKASLIGEPYVLLLVLRAAYLEEIGRREYELEDRELERDNLQLQQRGRKVSTKLTSFVSLRLEKKRRVSHKSMVPVYKPNAKKKMSAWGLDRHKFGRGVSKSWPEFPEVSPDVSGRGTPDTGSLLKWVDFSGLPPHGSTGRSLPDFIQILPTLLEKNKDWERRLTEGREQLDRELKKKRELLEKISDIKLKLAHFRLAKEEREVDYFRQNLTCKVAYDRFGDLLPETVDEVGELMTSREEALKQEYQKVVDELLKSDVVIQDTLTSLRTDQSTLEAHYTDWRNNGSSQSN